ncbi:MAG: hypothetical protein WCL18_06225 [bacterium]
MKKQKVSQKLSETKTYHITNVEELIAVTNDQLEDTLYIADGVIIPDKKDISRCYRSDFTLKTKKEAQKIIKNKKATIDYTNKESDFFVYNERKEQLLPFKKNDYLIYDHGYFTFDGKDYLSYDDNGNEVGKFPCTNI